MTTNHHLAGFGRRLAAVITDQLILGLIYLGSLLYIVQANDLENLIERGVIGIILLFMPAAIFTIFYYCWFIAQFGATLGKQIWGIKVTDQNDRSLSLPMAFFREFIAKQVNRFSFGLGFLWIIKDQKNQAWHDMLSGTYVLVNKSKSLLISFALLAAILLAHVMLWLQIIQSISQITLPSLNLPL
jgi:uncharacterized RDD family membrane protein YckC